MTENIIEVKSKFDAEFRRFSLDKSNLTLFDDLNSLLESLHGLAGIHFVVQYVDPKDNSLLPINNDDNYGRALAVCTTILRLNIHRKGESYGELMGYGSTPRKKGTLSRLLPSGGQEKARPHAQIHLLEDFRRVSSIIDVDSVPETLRRVKLMRNGAKPLGFYIRDGVSMRVMATGIEKVAGIFISRLVPGGLAETTGLLAVNDEVIEVNGIEVRGKTLDQVTDMMVANSSNLIITVKPVNQSTCLPPRHKQGLGGGVLTGSGNLLGSGVNSKRASQASARSADSLFLEEAAGGDVDDVRDFSEQDPSDGVITL